MRRRIRMIKVKLPSIRKRRQRRCAWSVELRDSFCRLSFVVMGPTGESEQQLSGEVDVEDINTVERRKAVVYSRNKLSDELYLLFCFLLISFCVLFLS